MQHETIHNSREARHDLLTGLWLQRAARPAAAQVREILEWALEVAASGGGLPPLGFVADLGRLVFGSAPASLPQGLPSIPGWPAGIVRAYEDHVLGRLAADSAFERAAGALRHYQGRDQARGLAFLLQQLREQAPFGGAQLSPAVIKVLLSESADTLLAEGWNLLAHAGVPPAQVQFYEQLIPSIRQAVTLWSPADLFELEHRTALAGFGDRLALRQVLEAAARFEAELPALSPPQPPHSREVSTRFFEEDAYPVGGFSSISTRGSLESLLHSQLAYMDRAERPDLFDIKFLRDELLYYARDENDFLRRRRTFFFVLSPDLSRARIKDAEVPWQRMILALAFVLAAIRTLTKWLSQEALNFEIVFLEEPNSPPLASEKKLFEILLREECAHGLVRVDSIAREQLAARAALHSQRSQCHQLVLSTAEPEPNSASAMAMFLTLHDPRPKLAPQPAARERPADETLWDAWRVALEELLVGWL